MTQAMVNNITGTVIFVLIVVVVGMIVWARWMPKPSRPVVTTPPPAAPAAPGAGAQAPAPTTKKRFWQQAWFRITVGILFLLAAVYITFGVLQIVIPWFIVAGLIIATIFIAGVIVTMLGKKGGGALFAASVALALIVGVILLLGPEYSEKTRVRIAEGIANGTFSFGSPTVVINPCPMEQVITLHKGEPVTVKRDSRCSLHLQPRWRIKENATIHIEVAGTAGDLEYVRRPHIPPSLEYDGAIEEVTFTNLGRGPTSVLFFYK